MLSLYWGILLRLILIPPFLRARPTFCLFVKIHIPSDEPFTPSDAVECDTPCENSIHSHHIISDACTSCSSSHNLLLLAYATRVFPIFYSLKSIVEVGKIFGEELSDYRSSILVCVVLVMYAKFGQISYIVPKSPQRFQAQAAWLEHGMPLGKAYFATPW